MKSKYVPLWEEIKNRNEDKLIISFEEVAKILGFCIDHSFLTYKKELLEYGYSIEKISIKNKCIYVCKNIE